MKVITLAAGEGKRLRPFTQDIPKCLVKFNNKPLYDYQLDLFRLFKIKKKYIITGYKNKKINFEDVKNIYNCNYKITNMVYSLSLAADLFDGKEDIIISYGDIIYNKKVLEILISSKEDFSIISDKKWLNYWQLRMEDFWNDIESFALDKKGNIKSIGQNWNYKSDIEGQYIGLFKIGREIQFFIRKMLIDVCNDPIKHNLYMTDFIQSLVTSEIDLKPIFINNGWLEFDTPNDLNLIFRKFLD